MNRLVISISRLYSCLDMSIEYGWIMITIYDDDDRDDDDDNDDYDDDMKRVITIIMTITADIMMYA